MHTTALDAGRLFFANYWRTEFRHLLDIGSYDVNGTLRSVAPESAQYMGIDLSPGPGVDLVLSDPYSYPFRDSSFDCIVSTSCFEHDDMFWLTFAEACRVLSSSGFIYINAPAGGHYHGFPYDAWRFYPDAGLALAKWARRLGQQVSLVESFQIDGQPGHFKDYIMVFTKSVDYEPVSLMRDEVHKLYPTVNVRRVNSPELISQKIEIN
jgi:SAM-dependent methyltransferase